MLHKVFTIYDVKAQAYSMPFFQPTIGLAVRGFTDAANDRKSAVGRHPADYVLFEIGSFDDASAHYDELKVHVNHGKALEYLSEDEAAKRPLFEQVGGAGFKNGEDHADA